MIFHRVIHAIRRTFLLACHALNGILRPRDYAINTYSKQSPGGPVEVKAVRMGSNREIVYDFLDHRIQSHTWRSFRNYTVNSMDDGKYLGSWVVKERGSAGAWTPDNGGGCDFLILTNQEFRDKYWRVP